ncbi:MAG: hypothetical protein RL033_491, partial [Pseudomonadota bacterium]
PSASTRVVGLDECSADMPGAAPDSNTPARLRPYEVPTSASTAAATCADSAPQRRDGTTGSASKSIATEVAVSTRCAAGAPPRTGNGAGNGASAVVTASSASSSSEATSTPSSTRGGAGDAARRDALLLGEDAAELRDAPLRRAAGDGAAFGLEGAAVASGLERSGAEALTGEDVNAPELTGRLGDGASRGGGGDGNGGTTRRATGAPDTDGADTDGADTDDADTDDADVNPASDDARCEKSVTSPSGVQLRIPLLHTRIVDARAPESRSASSCSVDKRRCW